MCKRCTWCGDDPIYQQYHDVEWGVPEYDSRALWEKLVLDGFQAGLSWILILKKRDIFRLAFDGFDPNRIARWGEAEVERTLTHPGMIRHRGKIEATITNARAYLDIEGKQGFANYLWSFTEGVPLQNDFARTADVPAQTPLSVALSKSLKQNGFKFCGPVITYAFMQAVGMVNDHVTSCFRHAEVKALARSGR